MFQYQIYVAGSKFVICQGNGSDEREREKRSVRLSFLFERLAKILGILSKKTAATAGRSGGSFIHGTSALTAAAKVDVPPPPPPGRRPQQPRMHRISRILHGFVLFLKIQRSLDELKWIRVVVADPFFSDPFSTRPTFGRCRRARRNPRRCSTFRWKGCGFPGNHDSQGECHRYWPVD